MKKNKIVVKSKSKIYPIYIEDNSITRVKELIEKNLKGVNKICIISDKNIPFKIKKKLNKTLKKYELTVYDLKVNEKIKSFKVANKIAETLLKKNFNRSDCIIALGGGIVGDLAAFIASIIKRGIKFVNIPTTLLSQVDSSIGGKTGINTKYGKNLIGSFYQPNLVISDITFLKSLPKRELICGYGEILKHSLISNKKFFKFLDKNGKKILQLKSPYIEKSIFKSCLIKKRVVEKDENELNFRKILNFGHTFAHAYEASMNFSKKLNHGEAVILGIKSASKFSLEKKLLKNSEFQLIENHIKKLDLPENISNFFSKKKLNKIISFMKKDKKNSTKNINLVLLKKIGKPIYNLQFNEKVINYFLKNELKK